MSNIVVRENVAWIYFAKCYPKNLIQFPLDLYLYIGQTLRPDIRPEQHMIEDKSNWKFDLLRSLTCADDWVFLFIPVIRKEGESFKNYMNRVGIIEKQLIRDFQTNYFRHGIDSYGLNASDGGEHPANGGAWCNIPGETSGLNHVYYKKKNNHYVYHKNIWENGQHITAKRIYTNGNPFLVFLYIESLGKKDIIANEDIFLNNVLKWWSVNIYEFRSKYDYLGITNVSICKHLSSSNGYNIVYSKRIKNKRIRKSRVLFSDFLKLYQDGILNIDDIYNLDFFVWNAKLVLEGKFDIENSRPLVFYADFLEFRKIHHFTVDNLDAAIIFLKKIEGMTDISIPVGQQRLQCN